MRPINFNEVNVVIAKDQPQYLPLPAKKDVDGVVTSCWGMTFLERIKILFSGRIWVQNMTFNQPLQPQKISVEKP